MTFKASVNVKSLEHVYLVADNIACKNSIWVSQTEY